MPDRASFLLIREAPGPPRLAVDGEVDMAVGEQFRDALADLIAASDSPAVVDLAGVAFFDSTGLNALVDADEVARRQGVQLVVRPSVPVARLLALTGLDSVLRCEDVDPAGAGRPDDRRRGRPGGSRDRFVDRVGALPADAQPPTAP